MSQQLIEALQQKAAATPQTPVWASPERRVLTTWQAKKSLAYQERNSQTSEASSSPETLSKNRQLAHLYHLLNDYSVPVNDRNIDPSQKTTDPLYYLSFTRPGYELLDWLAEKSSNPMIHFITETHKEYPSAANQDIEIKTNPVHAWFAMRDPIIDRLQTRGGFGGLFQKQERLLTRLGTIWNHCLQVRPNPHDDVLKFTRLLEEHKRLINIESSLPRNHTGFLAETFFSYELLIYFCSSSTRGFTGLETQLEQINPALKLARLIITKGVRNA